MSKIGKSILAAGAAAMLVGLGAASSAEAHGMHHYFGYNYFYGPSYYSYSQTVYGGGCGYYKRMWWRTGDYFWKEKYYRCIY